MSIELRLSNVNPPTPEPSRTIYRNITNLPDPVYLGVTAHYYNHDSVGLYFQITGSGTGYTFGNVNLGLLAAGSDAYQNMDQLASRAKPSSSSLPSGEMEETVTLTLKAYTDSGYTNLKWTFTRTVTIHWINSADPAFTQDFLNNFDDGTVDGWAATAEAQAAPTLAVATDYVLSPPYSLKFSQDVGGFSDGRVRLYKSFTTPNKSVVYAIIDFRASGTSAIYLKNLAVKLSDTLLVFIGKPYAATATMDYPKDKWMQIVVPLPANTTIEIRIVYESYNGTSSISTHYGWLDDFKIISK